MWNVSVQLENGIVEHCIFLDETKANHFYEKLKAEDDTRFVDYDQGVIKRTIIRSKVVSFSSPQPVEQYMKKTSAVS